MLLMPKVNPRTVYQEVEIEKGTPRASSGRKDKRELNKYLKDAAAKASASIQRFYGYEFLNDVFDAQEIVPYGPLSLAYAAPRSYIVAVKTGKTWEVILFQDDGSNEYSQLFERLPDLASAKRAAKVARGMIESHAMPAEDQRWASQYAVNG